MVKRASFQHWQRLFLGTRRLSPSGTVCKCVLNTASCYPHCYPTGKCAVRCGGESAVGPWSKALQRSLARHRDFRRPISSLQAGALDKNDRRHFTIRSTRILPPCLKHIRGRQTRERQGDGGCAAAVPPWPPIFGSAEPPKQPVPVAQHGAGGWGTVRRDLRVSLGENGSQRYEVWGRKHQDSAGTPKAIRYSGPDPTNSGLGPSVTQDATPKLVPTSPRTSHTRVSFPPLFAPWWLPAATDGCST